MEDSSQNVTELLASVAQGDSNAAEALLPIVYEELHRLATNYMRRERSDHTLQPTALIHEAFLRLTKSSGNVAIETVEARSEKPFRDLDHFVATAAVVMRRILVNHAKAKQTQKRGSGKKALALVDVAEAFSVPAIDLLALDEAMEKLAATDETQHRLVELRFFGGMTLQQTAKLLGISERTAYNEWSHARAWLKTQIVGD